MRTRRREFLMGIGGVVAATAVRGAGAAKAEMGDGPIKLLFTGTGGADWFEGGNPFGQIKTKGAGETRANAGAFLNDRVLIDLTVAGAKNLPKGAQPIAVFYTHSHWDHYQPTMVAKFPSIRRVYVQEGWAKSATDEIRSACGEKAPEVIPVKIGETTVESGLAFTPLPGNHWTGREGEQCVIYSVRTKKSHLLYATDTGGIMAETFSRLSGLPVITAIVMNAMVGPNMRTDRRIFTHSTPELVQETAAALIGVKRYQPPAGRPVWTTHLSYVMHGTQAEVEKAYPQGVVPAKDGQVVEI